MLDKYCEKLYIKSAFVLLKSSNSKQAKILTIKYGLLAQLVEHKTFNLGVPGSCPGQATRDTICGSI